MRNTTRLFLLAALLVPALASADETPAPEATASVEAAAPTSTLIKAAPADKGQIVFFREGHFVGGGMKFKVREGENVLGTMRNGSYFVAEVAPGAHQYVVHSEAKDVLNMEIEAGETYYVQGSLSMGALVGRPNLAPSDEATFLALSKKLKVSK